MAIERCDECGFDGADWTGSDAVRAIAELPARWAAAIDGLGPDELRKRPIERMWSIAEYTDHVRETIFGMRFVLDTALAQPGTALGEPPEPRFDPEPRPIDTDQALAGFQDEVRQLCQRLDGTPPDRWDAWATIGDDRVDLHWIVRHAVHDVTHHIGDVARLRAVSGDERTPS
jgi:uncharacterized damage-inducible protein DinB